MTYAICLNCGETKVGAFLACRKCSVRPVSEEDQRLALLVTDHYLPTSKLKRIGKRIKNGEKIDLDLYFLPFWKYVCWHVLKAFGVSVGFKGFFEIREIEPMEHGSKIKIVSPPRERPDDEDNRPPPKRWS